MENYLDHFSMSISKITLETNDCPSIETDIWTCTDHSIHQTPYNIAYETRAVSFLFVTRIKTYIMSFLTGVSTRLSLWHFQLFKDLNVCPLKQIKKSF